jgi:predicted TIM-barrel fold metal-dependent hydrolase
MQPLVSCIAGLGMVLSLHVSEPVGHVYPGKGNDTPGAAYKFIVASGELKVILAHLGGGLPFYELMPEVRQALSNAWYDTAAVPFLYRPEVYGAVATMSGAQRILFGSDWPLLDTRRAIEHIRQAGLVQTEVDAMLSGNARRLFNLEGG